MEKNSLPTEEPHEMLRRKENIKILTTLRSTISGLITSIETIVSSVAHPVPGYTRAISTGKLISRVAQAKTWEKDTKNQNVRLYQCGIIFRQLMTITQFGPEVRICITIHPQDTPRSNKFDSKNTRKKLTPRSLVNDRALTHITAAISHHPRHVTRDANARGNIRCFSKCLQKGMIDCTFIFIHLRIQFFENFLKSKMLSKFGRKNSVFQT